MPKRTNKNTIKKIQKIKKSFQWKALNIKKGFHQNQNEKKIFAFDRFLILVSLSI